MNKSLKLKAIAFLGLSLLTGCKAVVLSPSGDVAAQQRDLLVDSTILMLLIIIPVMFLTALFAWKYRAANKDADYDPNWDHSTKLELVIWAAPLLIIICLGALTWVGTHLLDPYRPLDRLSAEKPIQDVPPLQVQVVALDWKWLFIYPEYGVASVNDLAVPVDREVQFTLTSSSVMNAFYIPAMAGMIYAMPAMQTKLHGVFNEPGEYQGLAAHYSGAGFSGMRFKAHAVDGEGFDAWIAAAKSSGVTLDRPTYLNLTVPTENVKPTFFASVEPYLFDRITNLCVEPGKMCMAEMAAIDAQGGAGLAGAINVTALTYDKFGRRAQPVLGTEAFQVGTFCTPEDAERMFGKQPERLARITNLAPLAGHGLAEPADLFDLIPQAQSLAAASTSSNSDL